MSDLISRKALMESVGVADDCEKCQYNDSIHKGFCTMPSEFVNVCEAIADAPSAEPGWIPVTERLPKKHQYVLVTYKGLDGRRLVVVTNWNPNAWVESNSVAWMPVPEPHTGWEDPDKGGDAE